jgi:hypothetical protein
MQCQASHHRSSPQLFENSELAKADFSTMFGGPKRRPSPSPDPVPGSHTHHTFRFPGLKGTYLAQRIFLYEDQKFDRVATQWEKTYRPTFASHSQVPDTYGGENARVYAELPVTNEQGTVCGYMLNKHIDDGRIVILTDISGKEIASEFHASGNIRSDEIGNFLILLIATGGLAIIRRGVSALLEAGGEEVAAEGISAAGGEAANARNMVRALRAEGEEIVVNVGGEASPLEVSRWPKAINVNPITAGRPTDIPNLVKAGGEELGDLFESRSIDKVVSSKLPTSADPELLAKGAANVLRNGGHLEINIFGGGVEDWTAKFTEALVKNGFNSKNIKTLSDVLITAVK